MIKCPKCNEDNQLGAIFCRGCGDKLELDELRPDDLHSKDEGGLAKTISTIARNLIILVIILGIIGTVAAAFLKPSFSVSPELTEEQTKVAMKRFKKLRKGKPGIEYIFTTAEVNMLAKLITEMTDEGKAAVREAMIAAGSTPPLVAEDIYINLIPPNGVRLVLKSRLFDKVNFYTTVYGNVTASGNGLSFTPGEVLAGRIPIPVDEVKGPLLENFKKLIDGNIKFKQEVQSKITGIKIESGKVLVKKGNKDKK